jgi:hypothetical protein
MSGETEKIQANVRVSGLWVEIWKQELPNSGANLKKNLGAT